MPIVTNGLVGYWHYKQGVNGSVWSNIAPTNIGKYDSIINGATLQADGMYFDGVDDVANATLIQQSPSIFTFENCFYLDEISNPHSIAELNHSTNGSIFGVRQVSSGQLQLLIKGLYGANLLKLISSIKFTAKTLYTITIVVYTGTKKVRIYLNGIFKYELLDTDDWDIAFNGVQIGNTKTFTAPYKGKLIYTRYYNRELSDNEISQNYSVGTEVGLIEEAKPSVIANGLIGYWHYGQGVNGNTWENISPSTKGTKNLSIYGSALQADGMYFDGIDDYASSIDDIVIGGEYTIEIQFTPDVVNKYQTILDDSGTSYQNSMEISSNSRLRFDAWDDVTTIITANKQHATLVFNGTKTNMYINNTLKLTIDIGKAWNGKLILGKLWENYYPYKGKIHFVRFYNRALTSQELTENYAVGTEIGLVKQPPVSAPPSATIVSQSRQKIGKLATVDRSIIKFKFDTDVTQWSVNVMGVSPTTGIVADSGGVVNAGTEIGAEVDWTELYQEGENRVNIYGKNASGWTSYEN